MINVIQFSKLILKNFPDCSFAEYIKKIQMYLTICKNQNQN